MKNNFIKLTKKKGKSLNINPILIESLEEYDDETTLVQMGLVQIKLIMLLKVLIQLTN